MLNKILDLQLDAYIYSNGKWQHLKKPCFISGVQTTSPARSATVSDSLETIRPRIPDPVTSDLP